MNQIRLLEENESINVEKMLMERFPVSANARNAITAFRRITKFGEIFVDKSKPANFVLSSSPISRAFYLYWNDDEVTEEDVFNRITNYNYHKYGNDKGMFIILSEIELVNKLEEYINRHESLNIRINFLATIIVYQLISENLPEISIPDDYALGSLKPVHAKLVLNNLNSGGYSVEPMQDMLKLFPSSAVYIRGNTDEEPVAWALCYHIGFVRMVFTREEHRRKGLASLAINALCRKWLQKYPGFVIMSATETWNVASISMHEKLGFEMINNSKVIAIAE